MLQIVLATTNAGKIAEFRALFGGLRIEWLGLKDVFESPPEIAETALTFAGNALLKAQAIAVATGRWALADDSGLEVDVLLGLPGVRSARFAGEHATAAENNALLIQQLQGFDQALNFPARFRAELALVQAQTNEQYSASGVCEGHVIRVARGDHGFGYDPLFVPSNGDGRTLAELSLSEKNQLSHRARALANLRPTLEKLALRELTQ